MSHPQVGIFIVMFMTALLAFILVSKHLMTTLIFLEFMTLSVYFLIVVISLMLYNEMFTALLYLAVAVCEGAMALTIVVLYVRKLGNELIKM
uniref:NADH-ubiquinone oxidoreductase chain 4L n=1 Tax=Oniscus asellus TaxID=96861 RepID=A0A1P8DKE5_ONIAS|nr:NADH dehydrogenase subunit 4L [Oniscus asellus]